MSTPTKNPLIRPGDECVAGRIMVTILSHERHDGTVRVGWIDEHGTLNVGSARAANMCPRTRNEYVLNLYKKSTL